VGYGKFGHLAAVVLLALSMLGAGPAKAQSTGGQWANGPNLPFFPVHAHVLPNGTVMVWPGDQGINGDDPRVWDPATGSVTALSRAGFDIFCTGHSYLPDGRLFVAGGHISNNVGLAEAATYNPATNTWTRQPRMNAGRWYPTNLTLANGDVLVVSGGRDTTVGVNPLPQIWQAATGTWRSLTTAELAQPYYPYMFLAPNGRAFDAGPSQTTRYLSTSGTGAWSVVGSRTFGSRSYGSAVMYAPGRILIAGGGDPPTATAEVIDLNATTPAWRAVGSMTYPRRQTNATMLPDGKVLVTGGSRGSGFNNATAPVLAAEMWDPATEQWSVMASGTIPRLYHSIAMLLPDARVLVTGGNGYTQTEIFSPPYLFAGARPTIGSAPTSVAKGESFFVATPNAASITSAAWVRLPSVTHTNTMGQAFYRSTTIAQASGGINIVAPNLTAVPTGHYMLFLLQNGVPSVARIVRLNPAPTSNPVPTLASLTPSSTTAGSAAFTLTATGSGFVGTSVVRWNSADRPTTFVSSTQLRASIPAGDVAATGTAQVTVFNPAPGGGTSAAQTFTITAATTNPIPTLTSISPATVVAGSGAFTLTATGSGFVGGSVVRWNGASRPTTFVGSTQLRAAIPATDVAAAGTAQVTVFNPTPGGGTSAAQTFTIAAPTANPVPVLTSVSPTVVAVGSGFTLTATGSGFVSGSVVRWNGSSRPTTFVSRTQLRAAIPASDVAATGNADVTVFNPTPGGGTSAPQRVRIRRRV
jgi:hypothetical protein